MGFFSLSGGEIILRGRYKAGQYILLGGSVFVDGIYKISGIDGDAYSLDGADTDEDWSGAVYGLAIPSDFLEIVEEIKVLQAQSSRNPNAGLVQSERFQNYSYTMATADNGLPATWKDVFSSRLNPFREMFLNFERRV